VNPLEILVVVGQNQFAQLAFSGALGGLVRWIYELMFTAMPARFANRLVFMHIAVGCITATMVGRGFEPIFRPIVDFSQVDPVAATLMSGYFIGIAGLLLPALVIETVKRFYPGLFNKPPGDDVYPAEVDEADAAPPPKEGG
jgi:hypothetical protein